LTTPIASLKSDLEYIDVDFEVKQINDEDDEFFRFEGLASTFGNIDLVNDIVVRGAFVDSLATKTPVVLWQHFSDSPLGMPEEIRETEDGLFIKARLPKSDSFVSGRVIPQIKVGSIRSMSIGFRIVEREFNDEGIRLLRKVDLMEVSLVTFPANTLAVVSDFKSMDEAQAVLDAVEVSDDIKKLILDEIKRRDAGREDPQFYNVEAIKAFTKRELEKALRESGAFSKEASTLIAKNFTEQGEPAGDDGDVKSMLTELTAKADAHIRDGVLSTITKKVNSHARS